MTADEERRRGGHASCSTSGHQQQDGAAGRRQHGRAAPDQAGGGAALPAVDVAGMAAPVLEHVLRFVYTDGAGDLGPHFMGAEGAETLFDAADRYLLFAMKVTWHPQS